MLIKNKDIDVIILAGGFGTRIRPVINDRPKVLAPIGDQTLLSIVLKKLTDEGFRNFIISVGYMKDQIFYYIKNNSIYNQYNIQFSEENNPLGTGGAIQNALRMIRSDTFFVLNGDTFFDIDYKQFIENHIKNISDVSIATRYVNNANRYGRVVVDINNKIIDFVEKDKIAYGGNINGGIYLFRKDRLITLNLPNSFSIENDFFYKFYRTLNMYGFKFDGYFIDIGIPDDYKRAQKELLNYL